MKRKIAAMLTQTGFKGFPTRMLKCLPEADFKDFRACCSTTLEYRQDGLIAR